MAELASWTRTEETFLGPSRDGRDPEPETRAVHSKGSGPGVIIIHEVPGIEGEFVGFAEEVVDAGYRVWLPQLFGTPEAGFTPANVAADIRQFCVRREFSIFARGTTSPIATWLRSLAAKLHSEAGGPGVGVIGMCFTGGFALAMMADASVIAPVLAEPSLPAAVGLPRGAARRGADLGLSPDDLRAVKERGCEVLGLRYRTDRATGTRFATLRHELRDRFLAVEFEGSGHSVLTSDRRDFGVERVLGFLDEKLRDPTPVALGRDEELERLLESRLPPGFEARITLEPRRVVLLIQEGLTAAGLPRVGLTAKGLTHVQAITREVTGQQPEIARLTGGRSDPG